MTKKRRYQLLCPVARALDVVGDRWSLLILRDLHAGPARFQQLQDGLGLAPNLLTTRLAELSEAGLIHRPDPDRPGPYALTEVGRRTDRVLWELVRFGSLIDRDPQPRTPGSLRTVALPLKMMLAAVPDRPTLSAHLIIDGESFTIEISPDDVDVRYGRPDAEPDLVMRTDYHSFLDLAEGVIDLEHFTSERRQVVAGADRMSEFGALMATALDLAAAGTV